MSSINIFELESVQDLNEKEVASVIGGRRSSHHSSKGSKRLEIDVDVDVRRRFDTFRDNVQTAANLAISQGSNSIGDNNDVKNNA